MDRRVIVIGGGMSGLVSAMASAEQTADVTLLEAGPTVGGSMAISGGLIWAPHSLESARRWIPRGDEGLQRIAVSEIQPGWEWLESHGLPLGPEAPCLKHDMGRGRLMGYGEAGDRTQFAEAMAARVAELGATILTSARVTAARLSNGRWTVEWSRNGEREQADADAIIFAAGGFHNSKELVGRFITPWPEQLVIRGNRISDGVALRALIPLGGEMSRGMHSFYGHTFPWIDGHEWDTKDFLPATMMYTDFCVLVNQLGLRFKDESVGSIDEHNAQVGSRQPGGRYYCVFDDRIREEYVDADLVGIPGLPTTRMSNRVSLIEGLGATVLNEPDLASLAAAMEREWDVPAGNVLDSIRTYNEATDTINQLEPPRREAHVPLVDPPFWAIPCVAAITYTLGGMRVHHDMSIRGADLGAPVYAAGADAGNVYEDVYGGGLGWGLVSGRRAGTAAAEARQPGREIVLPTA
jgi:succinate dehydrogenase/fumarate reductase flavoprotein subunit